MENICNNWVTDMINKIQHHDLIYQIEFFELIFCNRFIDYLYPMQYCLEYNIYYKALEQFKVIKSYFAKKGNCIQIHHGNTNL